MLAPPLPCEAEVGEGLGLQLGGRREAAGEGARGEERGGGEEGAHGRGA